MTFVCWALSILKSSNTTAKLPSARCSRATVPVASGSRRGNAPMATVVGPDAAGLEPTLGTVAGGGDPTGLVVAPLVQVPRMVADTRTRAEPAERRMGGLASVPGARACGLPVTIR